MKFNKENISFQGTCSLLADLIAGGWRVGIGLEGFLISKPNYDKAFTGDNLKETKDKMRNVQKINRDKQIKSVEIQRFIARMERPKTVGNVKSNR